ncbi:thiamin pyrophosphokinase 1-like isoform X2 [Ctenocephalides felis]|uniref:thiamin pyrophosphokinase 1-like isoform X2 n=1 Tax=Ctenocephalides felis TaxID=7515 RepID=UPI000E6E5727|nr:thiamin pyrophosphokinase 1-like isoform X2 [Ctenocephalides felis]
MAKFPTIKAVIRVTVDGGTDRWLSFAKQNNYDYKSLPPEMITGDMDSIQPQTKELFMNLGSEVIDTPDQNETDFTKALKELTLRAESLSIKMDAIVAIVETSGRMDQIMSNINTLFKATKLLPKTNIFILSSASISWLLQPGHHEIHIPEKLIADRAWCALMPVGNKCQSVTTTGLRWNLKGVSMEFGAMVSTSNTYDGSPTVTINNSDPILWSMSMKNYKS